MAINGVIFNVNGVLLKSDGTAIANVIPMITRLQSLGVQVIAARNDGPSSDVRARLNRAGIRVDLIVTIEDIGIPKGSDKWVEWIKEQTGLATNQLFYVGSTDRDMKTAVNARVVFAHALWAQEQGQYGIPASSPMWVATVIEHIFRKKHRWWWTLDTIDSLGRPVKKLALISGSGEGILKSNLIAVFKRDIYRQLGKLTLKEFTLLHLVASMYEEGLFEESSIWWTNYPSSTTGKVSPMKDFMDRAAKLFRHKYNAELIQRVKLAENSNKAAKKGRPYLNQFTSVAVNAEFRRLLKDRKVLLLDDFITFGTTTEVGRNLLIAAGASEVTSVAIGKYGNNNDILSMDTLSNPWWDPYQAISGKEEIEYNLSKAVGITNDAAMTEFLMSYEAVSLTTS